MAKTRFPADRDRADIEAAVREAEKRTAGEIVPMVASRSHDYPRAEILSAMTLALGGALLLAFAAGRESMWYFLALFAVLFFLFQAMAHRFPELLRPFISDAEMDAEVREAAVNAFHRYGIGNTRDRTGILIYISLYERRVWVLADKAIDERVPSRTWDGIVHSIIRGISSGRPAEAVADAVARCGDILAVHFPCREDDTDELRNIITE